MYTTDLVGTRLVPGPQPPMAPQSKGTSGRVKEGSSADIGCRLSMWSIVPVREACIHAWRGGGVYMVM